MVTGGDSALSIRRCWRWTPLGAARVPARPGGGRGEAPRSFLRRSARAWPPFGPRQRGPTPFFADAPLRLQRRTGEEAEVEVEDGDRDRRPDEHRQYQRPVAGEQLVGILVALAHEHQHHVRSEERRVGKRRERGGGRMSEKKTRKQHRSAR